MDKIYVSKCDTIQFEISQRTNLIKAYVLQAAAGAQMEQPLPFLQFDKTRHDWQIYELKGIQTKDVVKCGNIHNFLFESVTT